MRTPQTPRDEAVAWLVGRLRFERLMTDLQDTADVTGDAPTAQAARAA